MNDRLDSLIARLEARPLDRGLGGLERDVASRLARDAQADRDWGAARLAAVCAALLFGVGVGGVTAANAVSAPEPSLFAGADALAPSNLLEGRR